MKIQVRVNPKVKQRWHFRIIAKNGKVLASSENYASREKCVYAGSLIMQAHKEEGWTMDPGPIDPRVKD